jgi:hypothetical protein
MGLLMHRSVSTASCSKAASSSLGVRNRGVRGRSFVDEDAKGRDGDGGGGVVATAAPLPTLDDGG